MSHRQAIAKLWRVMDYIRDRPQGDYSVADDSRIFHHSVRYLRKAIETLDNERISEGK